MLITKTSQLTGAVRSKELHVTPEQIKRWENGELIQNAMPNLQPFEKEFLITGITEEEWNEEWPEED